MSIIRDSNELTDESLDKVSGGVVAPQAKPQHPVDQQMSQQAHTHTAPPAPMPPAPAAHH